MADETFANPLETPAAFDTFSLDGVIPPGITTLKSGGNRKDKFENQQAPGTAGAFTLFKGQENSALQYEIQLWAPEHFDQLRAFIDMLNTGRKKRPPKVFKIVDPRIAHNNITDVCVADISALQKVGPAKWSITVDFTEYKKRAPAGGAPKRPKNQNEKDVEALNEENKALQEQLAAAERGK